MLNDRNSRWENNNNSNCYQDLSILESPACHIARMLSVKVGAQSIDLWMDVC